MAARAAMNLKPGDNEDAARLVLENSKCNNGPLFQSRGLIFDPETGLYTVDPDFDREAWLNDLDGKRSGATCTINDVIGRRSRTATTSGRYRQRAQGFNRRQSVRSEARTHSSREQRLPRNHNAERFLHSWG